MAARLIRDNRAMVRGMARAALQASLAEASLRIESQAKVLVPVDTGALLASISVKPTGVLRYSVVADKEYAIFQELGTSRHAAQPFLVPAALFVMSLLPSILRRNLAPLNR